MVPYRLCCRPRCIPKARSPEPYSSMSPATAIQRLACPACLRPQNACICRWARPVAHAAQVLILQHPLEVHNPKGSARLLHLSLPGSRLVTGETFADLPALLTRPFLPDDPAAGPRQPVLLYPQAPQDMAQGIAPGGAAPEPLALDSWRDPARLRLVVLDGTWRKSRKMLHCNPLLLRLPRLSLKDMPASKYLVRTAHRADQLSTLEATCAALAQLQGGSAQFAPLLAAFDGFVARQMAYRTCQGAAGCE